MSRLSNRSFWLAASIALASCGGGDDALPTATVTPTSSSAPASVSIAPSSVPSLTVGSSTTLTATVLNANGQAINTVVVNWSSSNTSVASVSASGTVVAVGAGTTIITADAGGKSASVNVTVDAVVITPPSGSETMATLPQVYLNTVMPAAPAAGGKVISVTAGGNFQTALNNAQPGDVIELANGATFTGQFVLPNKNTTSTSWIVIRPANTSKLPAEGARMTPTIAAAASLPVLLASTTLGVINTALGAHHYRFVGIEMSVAPTLTLNTGLVRFGDGGGGGQTTLAVVPHDLVLDRTYIHGTPTQNLRRAIALHAASAAIIDSYVSEVHEAGTDAQAIAGWNGPGPYKIVNNYLEASSENISWGGTDPDIKDVVASDIEIRHNHLFKPTAWKGKWLVKNLYESKSSKRSLIEGNILENNWQDGQSGSAIVLKSTNQSGGCTGCGTQDVTFRYNLIRNTGSGFALSAHPDPNTTNFPLQRVTIYDNVIANIDVGPTFDGVGIGYMINQNPSDLTLFHNTLISPTNTAIAFGGPQQTPPIRLSFRDNIVGGGQYGIKGPGIASGIPSISTFMALTAFVGNAVILTSGTGYPTGNAYPASVAATGFMNAAALDFHLGGTSPLKNKATDGRDPGANIDAITSATAGVVVP